MKSTRNLSLDVVRGLLSWGVVGVHIMWAAGLWNQLNINIGQWIVDCFMMLSGYVMTQLSLSKETSYGKYIFRRFMRLMPVFAVCFLFSLLIHPLMAGHTLEYTAIWDSENKFYWWHILFHSVLLHGVVPHTIVPYSKFAFLVPAWSISLEWQFYLVLPFILMFLKKFKVLGFLFLSILCKVFLFHRIIEQYFDESFLLVKLPFFLVGIALFILFNAPEFFNMAPLKFKLPSFAWNPLVKLGTISYSTYLIHWPIITIVRSFYPWPHHFSGSCFNVFNGDTVDLPFRYAPLHLRWEAWNCTRS